MTVRHIARFVALMLAILALIHGYWATAGRESLRTVLSSAEVPIPPPWAVWLVAGLLVVGALLVLGRAGDWGGFVGRCDQLLRRNDHDRAHRLRPSGLLSRTRDFAGVLESETS